MGGGGRRQADAVETVLDKALGYYVPVTSILSTVSIKFISLSVS
jgi:outer membrane biogenesis lipoprotein LolB